MFLIKIITSKEFSEYKNYSEYTDNIDLNDADEISLIEYIADIITDQSDLKILLNFCSEANEQYDKSTASTYLSQTIIYLNKAYEAINLYYSNFEILFLDQGYDTILKFSRVDSEYYSLKCLHPFRDSEWGKEVNCISINYLDQILSDLYKDFCFLAKEIVPFLYQHTSFQGWLNKMQETKWRI